MSIKRASVIVISDWLANVHAGQWTPFEAAAALKVTLANNGYGVYPAAYIQELKDALELASNFIDPDKDPPRTTNRELVRKLKAVLAIGDGAALSRPSTPARSEQERGA